MPTSTEVGICQFKQSAWLLICLIFIARLFNQDAVVFIAVFRVFAADRRILVIRFIWNGRVEVAVHVFHEEVMVEVFPSLAEFGGLVVGKFGQQADGFLLVFATVGSVVHGRNCVIHPIGF